MLTLEEIWDRKSMSHDEIMEFLNERGEEWLIGAMIDGSIGYHCVAGAKRIIKDFKNGATEEWCERCDACFRRDLHRMLTSDIAHMLSMESIGGEKLERIQMKIKAMMQSSEEAQSSISSLYPTM